MLLEKMCLNVFTVADTLTQNRFQRRAERDAETRGKRE